MAKCQRHTEGSEHDTVSHVFLMETDYASTSTELTTDTGIPLALNFIASGECVPRVAMTAR
jgi:hypothetical protein